MVAVQKVPQRTSQHKRTLFKPASQLFQRLEIRNKGDDNVLESEGNPDLWNKRAPKSSRASQKRTCSRIESGRNSAAGCERNDQEELDSDTEVKKKMKKKRLSAFEIIIEKAIRSRTELLALANEQKEEGKTDIAEFVVNHGPRVVAELLSTAWELDSAQEHLERSRKTRLDILREEEETHCKTTCKGLWLKCAREILRNNSVDINSFSYSVRDALHKGRGKYRNIMTVGPANCGKTFILNPSCSIYNTFSNPACSPFAWVGAEQAECIFLNDFRGSAFCKLVPHNFGQHCRSG